MLKIFSMMLQCGAFVFIPLFTLIMGLMFLYRRIGLEHQLALFFTATLFGFVFFEISFIGMFIDPKSASEDIWRIIKIAGLIGLAVFILALILGPLYSKIFSHFKPFK